MTLRLHFLEILFRLASCYFKDRITGIENLPPKGRGYIAAANHRSFTDGLILPQILVTARKEAVHMVSYSELFDIPLLGTILTWAEGIVLDRGSKEGIERFFRDAKHILLERHQCVGMHPEAHLPRRGKLRRGRTGAARLAVESGCPVVPVGLLGTEKIMPPGTFKLYFPRRAVSMHIGKPLDFSEYGRSYQEGSAEDRKVILEGLTTIIMKEIARLTGQEYHFGERALARLPAYGGG